MWALDEKSFPEAKMGGRNHHPIKVSGSQEDALLGNFEHYLSCIVKPHTWNGLLYPGFFFKRDVLDSLVNFVARPEDIFIASYPKSEHAQLSPDPVSAIFLSGTTWVSEMVSLIKCNVDKEHMVRYDISERVSTLEVPPPNERVERMTGQATTGRILQTHLPYNLLPPSITANRCKIIYVMRNPKDVAVSSFHHHKMAKDLGNYDGSFNDFLQLFIHGKIIIGSWFDHVKSYWEKREVSNILFIKYEELKKDLTGMTNILASYVGNQLTEQQVRDVVTHCSFESMKGNAKVNRNYYSVFDQTKGTFIRKGIVGDWKNYFDEESNHSFETVFHEKMGHLKGLTFEFE